ncbi:MAG: hypothetical protein GX140_08950 [Bacteroidales bacterium]|jgi:hypothetical protein|nr:hypothetical protein [Bacteroidales bacterium]
MKVRTFWTILLKTIGLIIILYGLNLLLFSLSNLFVTFSFAAIDEALWFTLFTLFFLGLYFLVLWILLFKTSWVIDKLRLTKGFEEDRIDLNFKFSTLVQIASIVIGGYIIITVLPQFVRESLLYFQMKKLKWFENPGYIPMLVALTKLVIAYFLIAKNRFIASFVNKQIGVNAEEEKPKNENFDS